MGLALNPTCFATAAATKWNNILLCVLTSDVPAEYGDDRPLDAARMRKLTVNGVQLLDRIDSNHVFVTELAAAGCITWPQRQHILDLIHDRDRNDKLLEFVTRRSVGDYENFIKVLSKYQAHLVPLLVTDGGETFFDTWVKMFTKLFHLSTLM